MRYTGVLLCLVAVFARGSSTSREGGKRKDAKEVIKADQCVSILHQLGFVLGKEIPEALKEHNKAPAQWKWPPPKTYSWRLTVLPFMEANDLYMALQGSTNDFKIPPTLSVYELKNRPVLVQLMAMMPEWLGLDKSKDRAGFSIYRKVLSRERPDLLIIVESADAVPWLRAGDELLLTDAKPLPRMGGNFAKGFFALCGDGRVRFLPHTLSAQQIRRALLSGEGVHAIDTTNPAKRKKEVRAIFLGRQK
jgi:hypothetical protein